MVAMQAEETLEAVAFDRRRRRGRRIRPGGGARAIALSSVAGSPDELRLAEARSRVEELPAEGSIHVVFQPIVDLATTEVIGYEALARFPGDPSVSPRTWFAEAAEVGLLLEVEMAAITSGAGRARSDCRQDAFVSVNVSPSTAGSEELRDVLGSVDPTRVVLEITENAAAGGYEEVSEAVGALRATGVRIALDDTGSGSVSFTSLFDVHADIIKIDIRRHPRDRVGPDERGDGLRSEGARGPSWCDEPRGRHRDRRGAQAAAGSRCSGRSGVPFRPS